MSTSLRATTGDRELQLPMANDTRIFKPQPPGGQSRQLPSLVATVPNQEPNPSLQWKFDPVARRFKGTGRSL